MSKYVYHSTRLRCRIRATGHGNEVRLQLQKRTLRLFWCNVYHTLDVSEGFVNEVGARFHTIQGEYLGKKYEAWATDALNMNKRITEFFYEYFRSFRVVTGTLIDRL